MPDLQAFSMACTRASEASDTSSPSGPVMYRRALIWVAANVGPEGWMREMVIWTRHTSSFMGSSTSPWVRHTILERIGHSVAPTAAASRTYR